MTRRPMVSSGFKATLALALTAAVATAATAESVDPATASREWRPQLMAALGGSVAPGPKRDALIETLAARAPSMAGRVARFRERRALNRAQLLGVAPGTSARDPIGYLIEVRVAADSAGRMLPVRKPLREFTAGRTVADAIARSGLAPELPLGTSANGVPGAVIEPFFLWIQPGANGVAIVSLTGSEYAEAWKAGQRAFARRMTPPARLARSGGPAGRAATPTAARPSAPGLKATLVPVATAASTRATPTAILEALEFANAAPAFSEPPKPETRADRLLRRLEVRFGKRKIGHGAAGTEASQGEAPRDFNGLVNPETRLGLPQKGPAAPSSRPSAMESMILEDIASARRRAREARKQAVAARIQAEAAADAYRAAKQAAKKARAAAAALRGPTRNR